MFLCRTSYEGQKTKDSKRMHGRGIFEFSDGNKYVGEFHDGAFHGPGILFFSDKNGGGQYRGIWDSGRNTSGEYIFKDGLQYKEDPSKWTHCTLDDRRLWHEFLEFVVPSADSKTELPPHLVASQVTAEQLKMTTPDYSTTDGVPAAFANKQPRHVGEVGKRYYEPKPDPEHSGKASVEGVVPAATAIAETRD